MNDEAIRKVREQSPYTGHLLAFHLVMAEWAIDIEEFGGEYHVPDTNLEHVAGQLGLSHEQVLANINRMEQDGRLSINDDSTADFYHFDQGRPGRTYGLNFKDG